MSPPRTAPARTIGRGTGFDPLLGHKAAQFDGTKFNWIGSANDEERLRGVERPHQHNTFADLLTTELNVGGTGSAADTDQFPRILNGVLGTKMKIITGYPGGNDVNLALERGEVDGRCGWSWSSVKSTRASWLTDKKITILMQLSLSKHPTCRTCRWSPTSPRPTSSGRSAIDLRAPGDGPPVLAPPGVPADRVAALRKAFMDTMADKEFLAEAEKAQLEITPVSGEAVQKLVSEVYQTPPEIAKKTADLLK
jgi:hypothetical protein